MAGVGNIFKADDGFATAVVSWLAQNAARHWPDQVRLRDFGTGGVHLVYELLDGYDHVVLVDAMHRPEGPPGTLYVFEPDLEAAAVGPDAILDAHDLAPESVLSLVAGLGGSLGRVTVVGCEPESTGDGLGLSDTVSRQVPGAGRLVDQLVSEAWQLPPGGSLSPRRDE